MSQSKRKRVSKKTKSSWRKISDIKDVEDFLDDQRLNERIGELELQRDDLLFNVDVKGRTVIPLLSRNNRREKATRPLMSLLALENTSKVQDPITKRNTVKQRNSDVSKTKILGRKANQKETSLPNLRKRRGTRGKKNVEYDIWREDKTRYIINPNLLKRVEKGCSCSFNSKNPLAAQHAECDLKSTRPRTTEFPHPGLSYNPSLKDYNDLMQQVLEKEVKVMKHEEHLNRVTTDMFSKITANESHFENCRNVTSKFQEEGNVTECVEKESIQALSYFSINSPVQNKKKNIRKLQNKRKQHELVEEKKKFKLEKKKITDIHRLNAIMADINKEEQTRKEIKRRKNAAGQKNSQRLAKLKFGEPDIYINSIQDLSGNLRNLKTEFSILEDRFKSAQKKNILPPSVDIGIQKRSKIKRFVRSSHK